MTLDPQISISVATLLGLVATGVIQWLRENRMRSWSVADTLERKEDADKLAEKLADDNEKLAAKLAADTLALAAKGVQDAADVARKLVSDAAKISQDVHLAAEKLANTVKENTAISTEAAKGAQSAFTEANSQNAKIVTMGTLIADLNKQVVTILEHIKQSDAKNEESDKRAHEEKLFTERVQIEIDRKLKEMNGHSTRKLQTRKR